MSVRGALCCFLAAGVFMAVCGRPVHAGETSAVVSVTLDMRNVADLSIAGPSIVHSQSTNVYACTATLNDGARLDASTGAVWTVDANAPSGTVFLASTMVVGRATAERAFGVRAVYLYPPNGSSNAASVSVTVTGVAGVVYAVQPAELDMRNVAQLAVTGPGVVPAGSHASYESTATLSDGFQLGCTTGATWSLAGFVPAGTSLATNTLTAGAVATHTWVRVQADYARPANGATGRGTRSVLMAAPDDAYETNNLATAAHDLTGMRGQWLHGIQIDEDWFKMTMPAGASELVVTCRFSNAEGDIDLRLTTAAGVQLAVSAGQGNEEALSYRTPPGGTYFLQVYGPNRGSGYDLLWDAVQTGAPTGYVRTVLAPPEAALSARWRVAGGQWLSNGALAALNAGSCQIEFAGLTGWIAPAPTQVVVSAGATQTVSGVYARLPPASAFGLAPAAGVEPLTVTFTDRSDGEIEQWAWDFDADGAYERVSSQGGAAQMTYSNAGSYSVGLRVFGPGGTNLTVKTNCVAVLPAPPVAEFAGSPLRGPAGMSVTFTNLSRGRISGMAWDFDGDGTADSTGMAAWVRHVYSATQSFSVALTVTGPGGTDTELKSGYIATLPPDASNRAPVLVIARAQIFLRSLGDMAVLDASDSFDPDGDPLCFSWREMPENPVVGLVPIGSDSLAMLPLYFPEPGRYEFEVRLSDGIEVSVETRLITVCVPGIRGVAQLGRTSGLVAVPNARVAVYASEQDANLGADPVDAAISDSQGRFVLEGVSPASPEQGRAYYVREGSPGFRTNDVHLVTVWPDPTDKPERLYEWTLRHGTLGYLRGWVRGPDGAPVPDADVWLAMGVGGEVKADRTLLDGSFGLAYVPMGSWSLQVRAAGFRPQCLDVHVGPATEEVHVRLAPATGGTASVAGWVTRAGLGTPLEGAEVLVGSEYRQTTDRYGRYGITGLPTGLYQVTVTKEKYLPQRINLVELKAGAQQLDAALFPVRCAMVAGIVADAVSGKPVRLATVGLESTAGLLVRSDVTDCTGYFALEDMPLGSNQTLRASAPGYRPGTVRVNVAGSGRIGDIRLARASNWRRSGLVVPGLPVARLAHTNAYLADLRQTAWLDARPSTGTGLTYLWTESPDNPAAMLPRGCEYMDRIQLSGFTRPGIYHYELRVRARDGGLSANTACMTVFAPGLAGQTHASPSDGIVGVAGVTVRAYQRYADALANVGYRDSKITVLSPTPGAFALDTLSTGECWVVARSADGAYEPYGPVKKRVNYSATGGSMNINLAARTYSIAGYVLGPDKAPLAGVRVVVSPGLASESFRTTTDTNGFFRLDHVPGGTQMLTLMKEGYQTMIRPQSVSEYTPLLSMAMQTNAAGNATELSGRITADFKGITLPVPRAELVVGAGLVRTFTDQDGFYRISGLAPGHYTVTVRREGYRTCWLDDGGMTPLAAGANVRDKAMQFDGRGPQIRGIVVDSRGDPVGDPLVSVVIEAGGGAVRTAHVLDRSENFVASFVANFVDPAVDASASFESSVEPSADQALPDKGCDKARDKVCDKGPASRGEGGLTTTATPVQIVHQRAPAARTAAESEPAQPNVRRLTLRDESGAVVTVLASGETRGNAAGVFNLDGLPDGAQTLLIELTNGLAFIQRVFVAGNMESAIELPAAAQRYAAWAEAHFGVNPPGETEDPDGDGMNNRQEYVAGTDPTRSNSVLAVGLTRDSAGGWRIAFEAASPARLYDVWWTSNLVTGLWQPVVSNQWGTGREMMWVVPTNRGKAGYFKAKARVEERVGW